MKSLIQLLACLAAIGTSQGALSFLISEEAGGNNATGRNFAATLPGSTGWNAAVSAAAAAPSAIGSTGTTSYATGAAGGNTLSFGGGLTAVISSIDFSESPLSLSSAILATDGTSLITSGSNMQDGAPTPSGLTGGNPYFNDVFGSTGSRHGVLFEFSQGVEAFGAFFGDLESANPVGPGGFTGTDPNAPNPTADGSGRRLGEIYVYDLAGNLLSGPQSILASSGNFTVNGTPYIETDAGSASGGAQTFTGAGNETTRHIGVLSSVPDIGAVLLVVGDDDTNVHDLSDAAGSREFISSLGFQAFTGTVPEPGRAMLLLLGAFSMVLRRSR